jgi:hypothetical protein
VYSAVIAAYYDQSIVVGHGQRCQQLILQVDAWCAKIPGKPWAAKFSGLAQAVLNERIGRDADATSGPRELRRVNRQASQSAATDTSASVKQDGFVNGGGMIAAHQMVSPGTIDVMWPHDASAQTMSFMDEVLPSMENFFGGQYLN